MWGARPRATRLALSTVVATALVFVTFGTVASSALAWGDGDHDSYTVNISPSSVLKGSSTTFDVALTNTSSPGSGLSSALIAPPLGFRVTHVSLPAGSSGHAYVFFNMVTLDRLSLAPGSTLHVAVTATAPSRCDSPFTRWFTWAKEGGFFGEDLRLDAANSSLTTSVTCDTATGVDFVNQPANTLINTAITDSPYNTAGSPVTVDVVDASGNTVDTSAPVTIALGQNPDSATLGGTVTQNAVHGVATFNDLNVNLSDNHYTLMASSSGLTSSESSQFDVSDGETNCNTGSDCLLTLNGPTSTFAIDAGPNSGQLSGQIDPGTPLNGPGSPEGNTGCAGYTPQNPDWYGFDVTNLGDSGIPGKTITWTVKNATTDGYMTCFGSTSPFEAQLPTGGVGPAPAGTLSDGTSGYVGFLPFCNEFDNSSNQVCITDDPLQTQPDENSTTGVDVIVDVQIPAGFPGDPYMGRG
jgi:hypothetical protein